MTQGKLYKYRPVSDRSLACLRSGTMHCATPNSFNDPFDCRIGVTFQSLFDAKCKTELDKLSDIFEKFFFAYNGDANIEDFDESEQRIIRNLLSNEHIMTFITEKQGKVSTTEEANELISKNEIIVIDLLQTVLSDESFKNSLGMCVNMLPKICESITPEGLNLLSCFRNCFQTEHTS